MFTQTELSALSRFLEQVYGVREFESFVDTALAELRKLIPAQAAVYFERQSENGEERYRVDPSGMLKRAPEEAWRSFLVPHPTLQRFRAAGRLHAVKLSDYPSARQLGQTAHRNGWPLPIGARDLLASCFVRPGGKFWVLLLRNRKFSEREREIMNLLRPHLLAAYLNSKMLTGLLQGSGLLGTGDAGRGVMVLTKDRRIAMCCAAVRRWLVEYFGSDDADQWLGAHRAWLDTAEEAPGRYEPLTAIRGNKRLTVRLLSGTDLHILFFAEEEVGTVESSSLEALGLTQRQAQVLALVTSGKPSAEIGKLLGIRPRSVEKHLENIYRVLHVRTRTAAAAIALQQRRRARGLPAERGSAQPRRPTDGSRSHE